MPEPTDAPVPGTASGPGAGAWFAAASRALTGVELDAGDLALVDAEAFVARLAALGWTPSRVAEHRAACRAEHAPWPHPVPASLLGPGTAARLHALVVRLRELTGTSGLVARQRREHAVLDAGDRRLLAEVPPHHGHV